MLGASYTFTQEYRVNNYYFVDIFIKELNLCVEVDGMHHYHGQDQGVRKRYQVKKRVLEALGYKIATLDLQQYMRKSD